MGKCKFFLNGRGLLGVMLGGFSLQNLDYWNTDSESIYTLCLIDLAARILGGDWEQFLLVFFPFLIFFGNDEDNLNNCDGGGKRLLLP